MSRFSTSMFRGLCVIWIFILGQVPAFAATTSSVTFTITVKSAFLRQEPAWDATRTYSVFQKQVFRVKGRNADNSWLLLDMTGATQGTWIPSTYGRISGSLATIEIVEARTVSTQTSTSVSPPALANIAVSVTVPNRVSFTVAVKSFYARSSPSYSGERVQSLFKGKTYNARFRSTDSLWLQIDYPAATTEVWVPIAYGTVNGNISGLPIAGDNPLAAPVLPPWIPVLTPRMRQLYQDSLNSGRRPDMFTITGDCNSEPAVYLEHGFDMLNSGYSWLEPTRNYFAPSFTENRSIAVHGGLGTTWALDPRVSPSWCNGKGLFACELDISNASVVFIMLGSTDHATWRDFGGNYRQIIELALQRPVLPVLVTKLDSIEWTTAGAPQDYTNTTIRQLAQEYELPLLDFWAAAQSLPNGGLQDEIHVTEDAMLLHLIATLETLYVIRNQQ